ncbi:LacI family DNA-binding transcriptional regulator [Microbacterium sp. JB110]|uniref:LacI family DNA-binding transcriptional regulator n=1 Tax=Microbacterium sp. JB110 TaxID=2024477 RepID=UPI00097EE6F2|nr:LacI family DNA-binding transcriptional regulator [Microbacterium sp. JB110]RCS57777.1 LacI family DNA-binding transcriptional regulator [Microbacterium sp. JB110]SJM46309.1 Transcriptional regulator, LacI family [Frigoribacterium sp. JB110]
MRAVARESHEGRGRSGRVTIADVAERAGVSTSTASLAFRGSDRVLEPTRQRILAAASALGYGGPHPIASSLRRGRSGIVGIVIAERVGLAFQNPVALATMDGLSDSLDRVGFGQLLLPGRAHPTGRPDPLQSLPVDAVVFATRGEEFDELLPLVRSRGVPMVGIEGPHADDITLVEIDDRGGTMRLAEHVADLGHTEVGVIMRTTQLGEPRSPGAPEPIGSRLDAIANRTIRGRLEAVQQVFPHAERVEAGGRDSEAGAAAAHVLLNAHPRVTAILAQNDVLAAGAVAAARERGLRVPANLTITGFDGIAVPWLDLPLTTMRQPLRDRGREAGRLVEELLAGGRPDPVAMPVAFVPGATAAPPPRTL